jgi:hypothetical protein
MLLDDLMPQFDATRVEHLVIDAPPAAVYEAAIGVDFVEAGGRSVRCLFALRAAAGRVVTTVRRSQSTSPPEWVTLRISEMPERGDWVRLAEDAPNEVAFGAIGRFWGGETAWQQIDASAFTSFDTPGYAKIAASLSLRPYGDQRTLLSYEARTQATDETARRAFLRYWTLVSPGVGFVMRSLLALIARKARRSG